eukprot:2679813-Rhodomonas_salina.1
MVSTSQSLRFVATGIGVPSKKSGPVLATGTMMNDSTCWLSSGGPREMLTAKSGTVNEAVSSSSTISSVMRSKLGGWLTGKTRMRRIRITADPDIRIMNHASPLAVGAVSKEIVVVHAVPFREQIAGSTAGGTLKRNDEFVPLICEAKNWMIWSPKKLNCSVAEKMSVSASTVCAPWFSYTVTSGAISENLELSPSSTGASVVLTLVTPGSPDNP